MKYSTLIIFAIVVFGCTPKTPLRPNCVPSDAVWAGGVDGGCWIRCRPDSLDGSRFFVQIFNDNNGELWSVGYYVLNTNDSIIVNENIRITAKPNITTFVFSGYDGERLYLSDSRVLLPHGTIDYPLGDGHGKRQSYHLGKKVGIEVVY